MEKQQLWSRLTRQRPWWPPDGSFVAVIVLSVVLAMWPFFDPQWFYRVWYTVVVVALMLLACLLSARDRWVLEARYSQQYGATLADLRARGWTLLGQVSAIVRTQREARERNVRPPDVAGEYRPYIVPVLALLQELGHQNILAPDSLRIVIENGVTSVEDVIVVAESLREMDKKLGDLYARVLSA